MRSVTAMVLASVSIGSGVWLHGYTQTNTTVGAGTVAKLISSSPLGSILGNNARLSTKTLTAILHARHGRLAKLRAALGLDRVHPTWANPAALLVIIGGVGSSVLMVLRGIWMRRRFRHMTQSAVPPDVMRILTQLGRGSDQPPS
jgi:hypothetical protein